MKCTPEILEITDGVKYVNLLSTKNGFWCTEYIGGRPQPKDGGVFADNPIADGRRLVLRRWTNVIDSITLNVNGFNPDIVIADAQKLDELLLQAHEYWLQEWHKDPVWIKARNRGETNIRYGILYNWGIPEMPDTYNQPFVADAASTLEDFTLILEHGIWQDTIPGTSTVLELSSLGPADVYEGIERYTGQSTDDGSVNINNTTIYLSGVNAYTIGISDASGGPISGLFRFPNITVPQGAVIRRAYISLQARSNSPDTPGFMIKYQDADDAATFSTYANYTGRGFIEASPRWNWPAWVAGNRYQTSDIKESIQNIVDRPGWASGNGMAFVISPVSPVFSERNRYFVDWDRANALGLTDDIEPVLVITWDAGDSIFGQERTDEPIVFVANKHNYAQLSNAYWYDATGPSWSGNLIGEATPFDLFPATPAAGDILYIGSVDGIFNSVVFYLSTVQVDITTAVWEYSLGADSWDTLTTVDLTAIGALRLANEGVNSVGWRVPSDWATDTIGSGGFHSVAAYWIRLRITAVGAAPASPEQDNRNIYTVTTPYLDIDGDDVGGDISALTKVSVYNKSDTSVGGQLLFASRAIVALRSLDRGVDFSPFINLSDVQTQTGITITDDGLTITDVDYYNSPTGRSKAHACDGTGIWETILTITIDSGLATSYIGRFHAYLRAYGNVGTVDNLQVGIVVQVGSGLSTLSVGKIGKPTTTFSQSELIDLGTIVIPNISEMTAVDTPEQIVIGIMAMSETAAGSLYMQDLILMPIDECIIDTSSSDATTSVSSSPTSCRDGYPLVIDNISNLKGNARTRLMNSSGQYVARWITNSPYGLIVNAKKDQRLWFLFSNMVGGGINAPVWIFNAIQVEKVQRYIGMRGRV